MAHYNISFDFTNPEDPKDVNHMKQSDLSKEEKDIWIYDILIAALKGTWIISHLTITKH